MHNMYKVVNGDLNECTCDDRQTDGMVAAGWSRTPPKAEVKTGGASKGTGTAKPGVSAKAGDK